MSSPYRKKAGKYPDGSIRFSPYWWISWHDAKGRRVRESTKTSNKTEARAILADREAAVRAKNLVFENFKRVVTFRQVAAEYVAWHCTQYSSTASHTGSKMQHLLAFFGDMKVDEIGSEEITAYRIKRLATKCLQKPTLVTAASVNTEVVVLQGCFTWARSERKYQDLIKANPVIRRKHLSKIVQKAIVTLDGAKKTAFRAACNLLPTGICKFPPTLFEKFCVVGWTCGMRVEEQSLIRKYQIDFENHFIRLEGTQTKNKKAGIVHMLTDEVFFILRELCAGKGENDLVFFWPEGDALAEKQKGRRKYARTPGKVPYSALDSCWSRVCNGAGLEHVTLHSMRKTAATDMARAGYDILDIKEQLNHGNVTTTMRYVDAVRVSQQRLAAGFAAAQLAHNVMRSPPQEVKPL